jgi:hypothetical protein
MSHLIPLRPHHSLRSRNVINIPYLRVPYNIRAKAGCANFATARIATGRYRRGVVFDDNHE